MASNNDSTKMDILAPISMKEKVGYGLGDMGFNFFWANISAFLLIFYTDVFGISAAAAGGTVPWVYRCLIDGLFGLKGTKAGLHINPQLPEAWNTAKVTRIFRGATFNISFNRTDKLEKKIVVNGVVFEGNVIPTTDKGIYEVLVEV